MTLSFAKNYKICTDWESSNTRHKSIETESGLTYNLHIDERSPLVKEKIRIRQNTSFLNGSAGHIVDEQNETTQSLKRTVTGSGSTIDEYVTTTVSSISGSKQDSKSAYGFTVYARIHYSVEYDEIGMGQIRYTQSSHRYIVSSTSYTPYTLLGEIAIGYASTYWGALNDKSWSSPAAGSWYYVSSPDSSWLNLENLGKAATTLYHSGPSGVYVEIIIDGYDYL